MRHALGTPLCDVSTTVLNKMVSKDVASSLRRFKNGNTKTPDKRRSKSRGNNDGYDSPSVKFNDSAANGPGSKKSRGKSTDITQRDFAPVMNNTIRQYLRDLDNGIAEKVSLLKMLVMKFDEADQNYNRLRNAINVG